MKHFFQPVTLGGLQLQNAIVMAPLTRNRATPSGVPQPYVKDYYAQRASAGLLITEGTQPSFAGQGYPRTPGERSRTPSIALERGSSSRSCMSGASLTN